MPDIPLAALDEAEKSLRALIANADTDREAVIEWNLLVFFIGRVRDLQSARATKRAAEGCPACGGSGRRHNAKRGR